MGGESAPHQGAPEPGTTRIRAGTRRPNPHFLPTTIVPTNADLAKHQRDGDRGIAQHRPVTLGQDEPPIPWQAATIDHPMSDRTTGRHDGDGGTNTRHPLNGADADLVTGGDGGFHAATLDYRFEVAFTLGEELDASPEIRRWIVPIGRAH
jgi:hypothetical protein